MLVLVYYTHLFQTMLMMSKMFLFVMNEKDCVSFVQAVDLCCHIRLREIASGIRNPLLLAIFQVLEIFTAITIPLSFSLKKIIVNYFCFLSNLCLILKFCMYE